MKILFQNRFFLVSIFLVCVFSFNSCSRTYKRNISFSKIEEIEILSSANVVNLENIEFKFNSKGAGKYNTKSLKVVLKKRLIEIMNENKIKGILDGNAHYRLSGSFEINEKLKLNSRFYLCFPICLILPPIGPMVFMSIPVETATHSINANISLIDFESGNEVLKKEYKQSEKNKINMLDADGTRSKSKMNQHLSVFIDEIFTDIAIDILAAIKKDS